MRIFLWGVALLGAAVVIAIVWAASKVGSDSDRSLDDASPSTAAAVILVTAYSYRTIRITLPGCPHWVSSPSVRTVPERLRQLAE